MNHPTKQGLKPQTSEKGRKRMEIKNNITQKFYRSKKALSPAIAVALLLAITIALVAAVSYAVSNTSSTQTNVNTPKAAFNVEISKTSGYIVLQEISGDSIRTEDLKLIFTANGVRSEVVPYDASATVHNTYYNTSWAPDYFNNYQSPWMVVPGDMPDDNPDSGLEDELWFGNCTISAGTVLKASAAWGVEDVDWSGVDDIHAMISNWDDVRSGDIINVMLVYTASNQVIWQGDVTVG
jgi:flagellin-like protein